MSTLGRLASVYIVVDCVLLLRLHHRGEKTKKVDEEM
jgi:hypothetical protein